MSIKSKLEGLRQIWQFDNRWQLIASRILFPRESTSIYRLGSVQFLSDASAGDANGARDVITTPMYRQFVQVMALTSPLTVFDVGANNGGFTLLLKTLGFEMRRVACVEMNPNTFSRLRFNIESNLRENCVLFNVAICGVERELELRLGSGGTGDTIYQQGQSNAALRRWMIKGMTFDDVYANAFGEGFVDICKVDIEGAEYEVFATPHHTSLARCRYLIIEIHDGNGREPRSIVKALDGLGFVGLPVKTAGDQAVYGFRNSLLVT